MTTTKILETPVYLDGGRRRLLGKITRLWADRGTATLKAVAVKKGGWFSRVRLFRAEAMELCDIGLCLKGRMHDLSVDTIDKEWVYLKKQRVQTRSGIVLGRISEVFFEEVYFTVVQIAIERRWLFFRLSSTLVSRQDIIDITPKVLIVEDAVVREKVGMHLWFQKEAALMTGQPQTQQAKGLK